MPQQPLTLGFLTTVPRGRVRLRCIPCQRDAHYAHAELANVFGTDVTLEALQARVTCRDCRRKVDGDLVTFELDLDPLPREEALRNMWGGFGGKDHLEELHAVKINASSEGKA